MLFITIPSVWVSASAPNLHLRINPELASNPQQLQFVCTPVALEVAGVAADVVVGVALGAALALDVALGTALDVALGADLGVALDVVSAFALDVVSAFILWRC